MKGNPSSKPPVGNKKLNANAFRAIIPTLGLADFLKIEYFNHGSWFKMISKRGNASYNCECCGVDNIGATPVLEHVRGKRHRFALSHAELLYHPKYTAPKVPNTKALTPILDAYEESAAFLFGPNETSSKDKTKRPKKDGNESVAKPTTESDGGTGANAVKHSPEEETDGNDQEMEDVSNEESLKGDQEKIDTSQEIAVVEDQSDEVIVLDDDDADTSVSAPNVSNVEDSKPQRMKKPDPPKFNEQGTTGAGGYGDGKPPARRVINPAAVVLSKSKESKDDNGPQYQHNRIIVPTVDKNKGKPIQAKTIKSKVPEIIEPSFSTRLCTSRINDNIEGIIGVEYVVKILKVYNDPDPFYECCLCEVVMDGMGMQTHLLGYNHRYKYLEKHFPTCFNQYRQYIGNIQVMGRILDCLAKAIENHHGRELPYECLSGEFRANRHGVMTTVYSFRHASEYSGPSFTNVVSNKMIENFCNQDSYQPPKPDPKRKPTFDSRVSLPAAKRARMERPVPNRGNDRGGNAPNRRNVREDNYAVDDATHKQMVEEFLQNTRGRSRSPFGGRRRRRTRTRSRSPVIFSHRRGLRRSPSPLRDGDLWQAYRHLVDRSKAELDDMYDEYRRDPEKHPLYDEEWRKFWKNRKEEIAREGFDYRNYNYQPEWMRYFAMRIEQLYEESLDDIKISSRKRLVLPMNNDELENPKYHIRSQQEIQRNPKSNFPIKQNPPNLNIDNKPSIVSVLRLLTALEDYLGSLGPKIVQLLSHALLVEKTNPREVNEIVLTLENCTMLETAMEKLKGLLLAGLLDGPKVRAFKNVISATESILNYASRNRQRMDCPVPQPVPPPKNIFAPNNQQQQMKSFPGGRPFVSQSDTNLSSGNDNSMSDIDKNKRDLTTKLANALVAQGKTDFNPEQLQQLIAVYSLIDKKKRDSAALNAATDKPKMTLSDTLTALLNPGDKSNSGNMRGSMGNSGGNFSNNNNENPGPNSSGLNNFISLLNRDENVAGSSRGMGGNSGNSKSWQNPQNSSLGNSGQMSRPSSGFMNQMPSGGGSGGGNVAGSGPSGGGGRDFSQNSSNFNRGTFSGNSGARGGNWTVGSGSGSNNSKFSRGGGAGGGSSGPGGNLGGSGNSSNTNFNRASDFFSGGGSGGGRGNNYQGPTGGRSGGMGGGLGSGGMGSGGGSGSGPSGGRSGGGMNTYGGGNRGGQPNSLGFNNNSRNSSFGGNENRNSSYGGNENRNSSYGGNENRNSSYGGGGMNSGTGQMGTSMGRNSQQGGWRK